MSRTERERKERRKTNARDWAKEQDKGFAATAVKAPQGVEFYKLEPGKHQIDIIPYVAGKGNPRADEGFQHFEREFMVHRVPTPGGKSLPYCCNWECFHEKCPVCEWLGANGNKADPALVKSLRGTTRHLWLVNDKPGDPKNKLKVFETNHYNKGMGFGEMVADAITSVKKYGDFAELENGMTLQLSVAEQTFPTAGGGMQKYNAVTRIDFLPRDYAYPEKMADEAPCLDDMLVNTPYKELKKILLQESDSTADDEEEDKTPKNRRATRDTDDDDEPEEPSDTEDLDEDDEPAASKNGKKELTAADKGIKVGCRVEHENEEWDVVKVSGDGTSLTLEDDDGEQKRAVAPEDCELVKKDKGKPAASDDDEDDEGSDDSPLEPDDEEEEEEDEDSDDDEEDLDEEDDSELEDSDDEDDEPAPKKKPTKQPSGKPAKKAKSRR